MTKDAKSKPMSFSNDIVPRVLPSITKNIKLYGKNSFLWFGPRPAVILLEAELIREVMSKSYIYQKVKGNPLTKMLAQGLASQETEKWAKHRRLINPAFHQEKLKGMLPSFYLSSCEMLANWDKEISSKESCEIDVWPHLQTLTSDAISRTAFGSNYEEGRKIFELQKEQAKFIMQIARSIYIPGWRFIPTRRNRRMKKISKEMNESILELINKRMKAIEAGESRNDDLLGILLESNYKEIQQEGSKNGGMSIDEVIEECKLFYFAGQETTSVLLGWTMILLAKHLEWQASAREEVLNLFGSGTPGYDELNHLKIVTMIFNEVLRLYSPGIMLGRMTSMDTKLGHLSLPAGVQLILPVLLLHHDKEIWGEDAGEFNPERFKEGISKAMRGQFSFFPFGWGPRICLGQSFAILEAKMALVMILQKFSFELSPSYTHAPHTMITLQPQYGAPLLMRKI